MRRTDGSRLWPAETSAAHVLQLGRIEAVLAKPHDGQTVVVTHHAPSARLIDRPLDEANAAFDLKT